MKPWLSQTAQVLGPTGGIGDYISGILVVPATTSPGVIALLDGATSIAVFTGGATSVSNLVPFFIPLGMYSVSGPWKVTTGTNVSCIGIGLYLMPRKSGRTSQDVGRSTAVPHSPLSSPRQVQ